MVESPRIAILTPYPFTDSPGGVEVFNEQLTRVLPGVQVFYLPRYSGHAGARWSLDSIGLEQARRAWGVSRRFYLEHRRRPFQLVICNGLYGWALSAFRPGIPAIQVYHFTFAGLAEKAIAERGVRVHMRYVDSVFDRFAGLGKEVVAVSGNVLEEVRTMYHHDGKVIPNGVDTTLFTRRDRMASRAELGFPRDARIGLYVGRAEYAKGFDVLREVIRASPETLFVLVGGASPQGSNTAVLPRVPHVAMPTIYAAADFLILPSRYEGFNLTILEALACGLPILVSRAAYPFDSDPRELGVVVDVHEAPAYVDAMKDLPPPAEESSYRDRVLATYSLSRFAENWRTEVFALIGEGTESAQGRPG